MSVTEMYYTGTVRYYLNSDPYLTTAIHVLIRNDYPAGGHADLDFFPIQDP